MQYNYYGDYHTHTRFSDAHTTVKENYECAARAGLKEFAITDHGFSNPYPLSLRYEKLLKQKKEIDGLRSEFPKINALQGVEADLISVDGTIDLEEEHFASIDILIAGFHRWAMAKSASDFFKLYFNANAYLPNHLKKPSHEKFVQNTDAAIKMLEKYPVDIYAHINSLLFVDAFEVAKACAHFGTFLEFNSKHIAQLETCIDDVLKSDAQFIFSSDAHKYGEIGDFEKLEKFAIEHGIDFARIVNSSDTRPEFRLAAYKNKHGI